MFDEVLGKLSSGPELRVAAVGLLQAMSGNPDKVAARATNAALSEFPLWEEFAGAHEETISLLRVTHLPLDLSFCV